MSRMQRVRQNIRRAYDTGRESVRVARAQQNGDVEPEPEVGGEVAPFGVGQGDAGPRSRHPGG